MVDVKDFWALDTEAMMPATNARILRGQTILGVKLPAKLLALLKIRNGGATVGYAHVSPAPNSWSKNYVPLHTLFGLTDPDDTSTPSLLDTADLVEEWDMPTGIVPFSGAGPGFLTLDYRTGSEPAVVWHDADTQQDMQVAETFAMFLSGLEPIESLKII